MSDILSKLFGSPSRVKIIRLFLLNPEEIWVAKEISRRARVLPYLVRREITLLSGANLISRKKTAKKVRGWALNPSFPLLLSLKRLYLNAAPISKEEILKKIGKVGKIKLVILAGIFIQEDSSRADILVVGDNIKRGVLERILKEIQAEVGKELNYAVFSTSDFFYRLNIYDKFIRDILDYPHVKILNKLGI